MFLKRKACDYYIRGAYGPGNLGDDILMLVMINILNKKNKSIIVSVNDTKTARKLVDNVEFVDFDTLIESKITFLGGGGQFFSFPEKNKLQKIIRISRNVIKSNNLIKKVIFKILKIQKFSYEYLVGIGLGIGPFQSDNNNIIYNNTKRILSKSIFLSVRDNESLSLLKKMDIKQSRMDTDLSFFTEAWVDKDILSITSDGSKKNKISLVIRAWPFEGKGKEIENSFEKTIAFLKNKNYDVQLVSLYKEKDKSVIDKYNKEKWLIWDPNNYSINDFFKELKKSTDIVISVRAHGVLLSSIIGIPSISVIIEPKLKNIAELLPNSVSVINDFNNLALLEEKIIAITEDTEILVKLESDVNIQKQNANEMIRKLEEILNDY
jgi:polysaccharide pyruvyl transferase WcaK-like protein